VQEEFGFIKENYPERDGGWMPLARKRLEKRHVLSRLSTLWTRSAKERSESGISAGEPN
jgi:hypothetical protein